MREKKPKLVITFPNTSAVMALDAAYTTDMGGGKIIPVPGEVAAGCGLAWCDVPEAKESLCKLMAEKDIPFSAISFVDMY